MRATARSGLMCGCGCGCLYVSACTCGHVCGACTYVCGHACGCVSVRACVCAVSWACASACAFCRQHVPACARICLNIRACTCRCLCIGVCYTRCSCPHLPTTGRCTSRWMEQRVWSLAHRLRQGLPGTLLMLLCRRRCRQQIPRGRVRGLWRHQGVARGGATGIEREGRPGDPEVTGAEGMNPPATNSPALVSHGRWQRSSSPQALTW